jgi:hypothetical protein
MGRNLTAGSHTWYCNASAGGYQPQISNPQTYQVVIANTSLTVNATPPSPQYVNGTATVNVNFTALYMDVNVTGRGIRNANVTLYINGSQMYNLGEYPNGIYMLMTALPIGNYTWYFTASAYGYQFQTSSPQTYHVILPGQFCLWNSCTFGGNTCNASCIGINGCYNFSLACDNYAKNTQRCSNSTGGTLGALNYYVTCCNGLVTSCGVNSISCSPYCSGSSICTYPSNPATCSKTCSGGSCQACTPSCRNATCSACASGKVCSAGACVVSGGGGSPLIRKTLCSEGACAEPTAELPVGNTWTIGIVILALLGLGIGYFILKEVMLSAATRKKK